MNRRLPSVQEAIRKDKAEDAREITGPPAAMAREDENPKGVWAYPNAYSVFPGDVMLIHMASTFSRAGVKVYQLTAWNWNGKPTWTTEPLQTIAPKNVPDYTGPQNAAKSGIEDWEWAEFVELEIGNWPSGIYVAEVSAYDRNDKPIRKDEYAPSWVEFVVRNPSPGAPILYKLNLYTIAAYNLGMQDGYSQVRPVSNDLYVNVKRSPDQDPPGYKVTLRRPAWSWAVNNKSVAYDYPMIKWLEAQEYQADYCTDVDLTEVNPDLLSPYRLLLSIGHDEYWSESMRANATAFRDNGGNIAFLSGNTVCWRVHPANFDGDIPTAYVCDKGPESELCDVNGPDAWWKIDKADNRLVGVGTRNCGFRYDEPSGPFSKTTPSSDGFTVQNAANWVFDNTGLKDGDVIGYRNWLGCDGQPLIENLVGYEGGGARIEIVDGVARLTFNDGTPRGFKLLGVAKTMDVVSACERGDDKTKWFAFTREGGLTGLFAATMGVYTEGGTVFTASTIHWVNVLNEWDTDGDAWRKVPKIWCDTRNPEEDSRGHPILGNRYLHYITRNVIDKLQQ